MRTIDIRCLAYSVLRANHPKKMSAKEISDEINILYGNLTSRSSVHHALREFARQNKHFAIYHCFFPRRVKYSIYILSEPYDCYKPQSF